MNENKKIIKAIVLAIFFVIYVIYLYWRAVYTIPFTLGYVSIIAGIFLFIAEFVGFIEAAIFYITLWNINTPTTPSIETKDFPDIDVFIATYNEPKELLYKTIIGCKNMEYPDKNRVHIYICDDGNRNEIRELCKKMSVGYITRTDNTHAKAGNLNNALRKTNSPYIVTLDADMIPMHDFLMKTIPFFLTEESIGFVQVPQNFYNPDPFQYNLFLENNIPNEQNLFSRLIQAGKSRFNAIIYAGSNTVISRQALDDIGGLALGTITEDFATGMLIQSKGYKCICLNEVHASGLSPESLEDLYNQRIRWGRGVVQTFKAYNPLFLRGLNIMQKIMYFSSLSYWYFGIWRFIFLSAPIAYSVFGIIVLSADALAMLKIWLPMFILTNITFKLFVKNIRNSSWSHIYDTIMFPQVTKGVILETLGTKMAKFKVTPKDKVTREAFINKFELVRVQIILAILTLIGIVKIIYSMITKTFSISYIINIFWLVYNLYLLIMAIFFASQRPKFRNSERLQIHESASVYKNTKIYRGVTNDISETGVSIILDKPIYLDENTAYEIEILTQKHLVRCLAKIIRVDNINDKYKYVFHIVKINQRSYEKLICILYDRVPLLPESLISDRVYRNLRINFRKRKIKPLSMNRRLPRILIDKSVTALSEDGSIIINLYDFNFMYCSVRASKEYSNLIIPLENNGQLELKCVLDEELTRKSKRGVCIYFIKNYKDIVNRDEVVDLLRNYDVIKSSTNNNEFIEEDYLCS